MARFLSDDAGIVRDAGLGDRPRGHPQLVDFRAPDDLVFGCVPQPEEFPRSPDVVVVEVGEADNREVGLAGEAHLLAKLHRQVTAGVETIARVPHVGKVQQHEAVVGEAEQGAIGVTEREEGEGGHRVISHFGLAAH